MKIRKNFLPLILGLVTLCSCSRNINHNISSPVKPSTTNPVVPPTPVDPTKPEKKVDPTKFFNYETYEESATISGIKDEYKNRKEITIPEIIDSKKVTTISRTAFKGNTNIEKVTLPKTLVSIGAAAFYSCSNLKSINIPASLNNLDQQVFAFCSSLEDIKVDEENKEYASIDGFLLNKDKSLLLRAPAKEELSIPEGVKEIEKFSFSGLKKLKKIYFSGSVKKINVAFNGCENIEEIKVSKNNNFFADFDSNGVFVKNDKNILWLGCKNTYLNSEIDTIADSAFSNVLEFSTIKNDSKYLNIKDNCILNSDMTVLMAGNKKSVIPSSVTTIDYGAFSSRSDIESITLPKNVKKLEDSSFSDILTLKEVDLGEVEYIKDAAFQNCHNLKYVSLPKKIEVFNNPFEGCFSLSKIKLNNTDFKTLSSNPFETCKLEKIEGNLSSDSNYRLENNCIISKNNELFITAGNYKIPEGCITIAEGALVGNRALDELIIPKSVKKINSDISNSPLKINKIISYSPYYYVENGCLITNDSTKELLKASKDANKIPEGVTKLDDYCFAYSDIKKIEFPKSLKEIGNGAFKGCNYLDDVIIPKAVFNLEAYSFIDCHSLNDIYFEDDLKTVRDHFKMSDFYIIFSNSVLRATIENKVYHSYYDMMHK